MTGFFGKIIHNVKAVANDAADALEDPGRVARQDIRDLQRQITSADNALIDAKAQQELLRGKVNDAEAQIEHWTAHAKKAVAAGDDSLARDCLNRKQPLVDQLAIFRQQLAEFEPSIAVLETRINDLRSQKDQMDRNTDLLTARSGVAKATEQVAVAIGAIDGSGASQDFKRLNDKVAHQEARATAALSQAAARGGDTSLEQRVAALGKSAGVDEELNKLKADLGK